jgi:hypothetical protein
MLSSLKGSNADGATFAGGSEAKAQAALREARGEVKPGDAAACSVAKGRSGHTGARSSARAD